MKGDLAALFIVFMILILVVFIVVALIAGETLGSGIVDFFEAIQNSITQAWDFSLDTFDSSFRSVENVTVG